jgi:hypothetical protein
MRKLLAAAATTISAVALISGTGLAMASAHAAHPATSNTEHFREMTTSATSSKSSLIATGVFTAGGIDNQGVTPETFTFPNGTIQIKHHAVHTKQTLNSKTCLFTVSQSGTYKLIGGTGTYTGISGHGTYALSILAVLARSKGKCSMSKLPAAYQQTINAHGPVTL